jgi:uncharacterized membrane-anchored protein
MKKFLMLFTAILLSHTFILAKEPGDTTLKKLPDSLRIMLENQLKVMDSVEKTLHYKTGIIELSGGLATINVDNGFRFLESDEAEYVLTELWGNLKGTKPLGLLFPPDNSATGFSSYAYLLEYEGIGYVKDKDADKIDYDDLMKEMKESEKKANEERSKLGLSTMEMVGWAEKPHYDKEKKHLYWAKEFSVSGQDENTLNYDIRILGRKGVLNLSAIATMDQLDSVNKELNNVLSMVSFNKGNTYSDFDSKTDDVAAWTIGGLVAGKILAKAGFFALILKNIKLIGLAIVAFGGGIWRFIRGRRKKEEEFVYESQPAPANTGESNPQ